MDDTSSVEPRVAVPQAADTAAVPWWRTPAVLISALAFVLSLGTALVSIYTAHIKDVHDRQKELSDIVEKLLQLPLTEASIYSKGLNDKAISLQGVFNDQENMLTNQAYNLTRKLGANAPTVELLVVGRYLVNAENYAAVKRTYRLATEVADNFSDEVYSLRVLGDALIRYGQSDRERAEGEEAFEAAMNIGTRYPDLARNIDEISYTNLLTQLAWLSTWSGFDCRRASFHLEQADKFSQTTGTWWSGQADIAAWREALNHCDDHNKLPPQFYPILAPRWAPATTASIPTLPDRETALRAVPTPALPAPEAKVANPEGGRPQPGKSAVRQPPPATRRDGQGSR